MTRQSLETLSALLWRAGLMCLLLATVWFLLFTAPGGWLCQVHGSIFALSNHDCAVLTYAGIALLKIFAYVFFLFPWVAVRLVLRKMPGNT